MMRVHYQMWAGCRPLLWVTTVIHKLLKSRVVLHAVDGSMQPMLACELWHPDIHHHTQLRRTTLLLPVQSHLKLPAFAAMKPSFRPFNPEACNIGMELPHNKNPDLNNQVQMSGASEAKAAANGWTKGQQLQLPATLYRTKHSLQAELKRLSSGVAFFSLSIFAFRSSKLVFNV